MEQQGISFFVFRDNETDDLAQDDQIGFQLINVENSRLFLTFLQVSIDVQ